MAVNDRDPVGPYPRGGNRTEALKSYRKQLPQVQRRGVLGIASAYLAIAAVITVALFTRERRVEHRRKHEVDKEREKR